MQGGRRQRRASDRGAIAAVSVFFVLLMLTFLGLTINIGRLLRTKGDLQNASDSAALAAAETLDVKGGTGGPISMGGTGGGRETDDFDSSMGRSAQSAAKAVVNSFRVMNEVNQLPVFNITTNQDLLFGFWHWKNGPEKCAFTSGMCGQGWEPSDVQPPTCFEPLQMFGTTAVSVTVRYQVPPVLGSFLGQTSTWMKTTSIAVGRRSRVKCAMPFAVSTYDAAEPPTPIVYDSSGVEAGLYCDGHNYSFTSQNLGCSATLARVDVTDQQAMAPGDLKAFVRSEIVDNCANDTADTHYYTGAPTVPATGLADSDIRPIVDGLLGIPTRPGGKTGPCRLGQPMVLPVIKYGVQGIHACPTSPWPPDASAVPLVVGFVNVIPHAIYCKGGGDPLTATGGPSSWNCNATDAATLTFIENCTGWADPAPGDIANLSLETRIGCDAPTGPNGNFSLALQPRLVK